MKKTSPLFSMLLFILVPLCIHAQTLVPVLNGKVLDEKGQALPGATVAVKGTSKGTVTNNAGMFTLKDVPANAPLLVTFQGYESTTVDIRGQSAITVTLKADISKLGDVVVVGYGTQKKIASTGSIASVKGADITQTPVTNVAQGLAARVRRTMRLPAVTLVCVYVVLTLSTVAPNRSTSSTGSRSPIAEALAM